MPADDGAGGLRERDDASRTLECLETARNLGLLDRQAVRGERIVGFAAEFVADARDPALKRRISGAAFLARREMRVDGTLRLRFRPVLRELDVTQVATPQTVKK
jgi:hypothetical protein